MLTSRPSASSPLSTGMMECSAAQQRYSNVTSRISHHGIQHHHISSIPSTSASFKGHQTDRHRTRSAISSSCRLNITTTTMTGAHMQNHVMQQFGKSCMYRTHRDGCVVSKRNPFASFSLLHNTTITSSSNEKARMNIISRADMGGQYYGDSFQDVDLHMIDYFTYKSLRVVLEQVQEMDTSPGKGEYTWLYQFAVKHSIRDSKMFMKTLLSERPDFGERLIVTRTHLCEQYLKKFEPAKVEALLQESNLQLRREQLMTTVKFENLVDHPLKEENSVEEKSEKNDNNQQSQ